MRCPARATVHASHFRNKRSAEATLRLAARLRCPVRCCGSQCHSLTDLGAGIRYGTRRARAQDASVLGCRPRVGGGAQQDAIAAPITSMTRSRTSTIRCREHSGDNTRTEGEMADGPAEARSKMSVAVQAHYHECEDGSSHLFHARGTQTGEARRTPHAATATGTPRISCLFLATPPFLSLPTRIPPEMLQASTVEAQ